MSDAAKRILLTLASGAYLASPIDLVPDVIPILGLTDDTAFILLALYSWYTLLRKRKQDEELGDGRVIDIEPTEPDTP